MKHHIALKFLAVILAALSLLGALASGACIIGLTATDLYDNQVEDLYNEAMHETRQQYAVNLAHRYASLELGKLPDQYLNDYYGLNWMYNTFRYNYFFYSIYNEHGALVESTMENAPAGGTHYEMAVTDIRYRSLVQVLPEQTQPTESLPEATVPQETAAPVPTAAPETIPVNTTPTVETAPQPTEIPVETPTATEPVPEETHAAESEATVLAASEQELHRDSYYDHEKRDFVEFFFTYEYLPPYTVDLYLLPGAMPEEYAWTLLRQIWDIRYELFYILAGSLLIFAIAAVYLCCSAGRKPGREELRAGGFNRISLDLYAAVGGLGICGIGALGYTAAEYLLRSSPNILVPVVLLAGFTCCLIFVGFCFACAAQFKTPEGFWWRNCLAVRCLRLAKQLCIKAFSLIPKAFSLVKKLLMWCWAAFNGLLRGIGQLLHRLLTLLPLTWQWVLGGGLLLIICALVWANRRDGWGFVWMLLAFGLILFVAQSFGILRDAARRMGKGDLDTKVDDRRLVGCFKDFAQDLNGLADVAVVAAQKQMKSERMKTELITNVSHDIKTPLTSIINYVDLLQKPHTDEEQDAYLEVLSRQSQQLKKLIEDLMEMSKASTGNMSVDITSVNAAEAINQALGEFADKLDKVQLVPVFRQPETPICMKADGRLVWRVLSNLLSNAVKYALPGTRLYIDLMELEGKVFISLKNISREELNVSADELLERFVRGDASRNTEGSGLGLNIAQSLMELQKGKLELKVDGDLFKVTLVFPAVPDQA